MLDRLGGVVRDERGLAVFELIRRHGTITSAMDGKDLRREPIEKRKQLLKELLSGSHLSIVLNEHFEEDDATVFREACKLGCEVIVSKRLGSPYRSGPPAYWVKVKNPKAPAPSVRPRKIGAANVAALAISRRPGQSRNWRRVSSCSTRVARSWVISISKTSDSGAWPSGCSPKTRRGAWR
jgi:hypothetical protein